MTIRLYGDKYSLEFSSKFKRWLFFRLFSLDVQHISKLGECAWINIPPTKDLEEEK